MSETYFQNLYTDVGAPISSGYISSTSSSYISRFFNTIIRISGICLNFIFRILSWIYRMAIAVVRYTALRIASNMLINSIYSAFRPSISYRNQYMHQPHNIRNLRTPVRYASAVEMNPTTTKSKENAIVKGFVGLVAVLAAIAERIREQYRRLINWIRRKYMQYR